MKLLVSILILFSSFQASAWETVVRRGNIVIEKEQYGNTDLYVLRGRTVLKTHKERSLEIIMNTLRHKDWIPGLIQSKILKSISPEEKIVKQSFSLPWPCDDRWMTYNVKATRYDKHIQVDMKSVEVPKIKGNGVKANMVFGQYLLHPVREYTSVDFRILIDPKGSIPSFLIPEFQRDWMLYLLTNLKAMV